MWIKILALSFLSSLFCSVSNAQDSVENSDFESPIAWSGRVYTNHHFPLYTSLVNNGVLQSSLSAWLDFTAKLNEKTSVHFVGQGDAFYRSLSQPLTSSFSAKLREGFLSYQTNAVDFRVGQQIIPWGKSDGVNPTDYFTAKDYTLLNPDDEVRRTGAPSVMLSFTPKDGASPVTITGVFQAVYPQTKLLIPDQAIPSGVNFEKYPTTPSPFRAETIEFGGKISYLKNNFDFSASVFRGMNHFAQYIYQPTTNTISPENIQQTAVGGDLSFTKGDFVFRAESAYILPDKGSENSALYGLLQPAHWDSVAGVERSFFDDFHAQFQFLYRYYIGYLNPSLYATSSPILTQVQQNVARANALLLNFQRQNNPGATIRFGYASDTSLWTADIFLMGYFSEGQDFLLRPQVSYKPVEGLRLLAGMDLYGGDESRPLGALKKNSSVFFEGRYLF